MSGLIIPLLWLLAGGLSVMMLVQGLQRKVDLLSVRNIYLAGFIVYQIFSPISALRSTDFFGFRINNPSEAAKWFVLFAYVFVAIYLLSYHKLRLANWVSSKFSFSHAEGSDSLFMSLAIGLTVAALLLRLVMQVPILRGVSVQISLAFAAMACAICGWVWSHRRLNPVVLIIVGIVLAFSLSNSLAGIYSRRPLISMVAGFAWGAYYRWARQLKPSRLIFATAPLVIAATLIVAAFTAVRGNFLAEGNVTLGQMRNANLSRGTADLLSGQTTGAAALWILEKYPREIDYNHLFSLKYLAYYYVPRALWEDKPETLANDIATLARLRGVNRDVITLPPGVIGYAAAEGGFYALVIYAIFFGQFTRFFDDLVRRDPTNPFIVLPVGCTIGQYLGLARGEISAFTNLIVIGFVSSYLMLYLARLAFGRTSAAPVGSPWPQMR